MVSQVVLLLICIFLVPFSGGMPSNSLSTRMLLGKRGIAVAFPTSDETRSLRDTSIFRSLEADRDFDMTSFMEDRIRFRQQFDKVVENIHNVLDDISNSLSSPGMNPMK